MPPKWSHHKFYYTNRYLLTHPTSPLLTLNHQPASWPQQNTPTASRKWRWVIFCNRAQALENHLNHIRPLLCVCYKDDVSIISHATVITGFSTKGESPGTRTLIFASMHVTWGSNWHASESPAASVTYFTSSLMKSKPGVLNQRWGY